LYDEASLQSILDLTADWTPEERQMLRNKVASLIPLFSFVLLLFNPDAQVVKFCHAKYLWDGSGD